MNDMSKEMKETWRNLTKYEMAVTKKQIEKENGLLIDWIRQATRKHRKSSETQEIKIEEGPIEVICMLRRNEWQTMKDNIKPKDRVGEEN